MVIMAATDNIDIPSQPVAVGQELAQEMGEKLVVLHVLSQEKADRRIEERPDYYLDDAQKDAESIARDVVESTVQDRSNITYRGRVGDPAVEILEEIERLDPRYVVIGGRKRSPVGKALFGSVTQSVLLEATVPIVTTMREQKG